MAFDNPHGFIPIGGPSHIEWWTVKAATTIYKWDLVVTTPGEGTLTRAVADQSDEDSTRVVGVAQFGAVAGDQVAVETHPDRIYQVQLDTKSDWDAADIGSALDLAVGDTPSAVDAISQMSIDSLAAESAGANGCCTLIDKITGPEIGGGEIEYGSNLEAKVKLRASLFLGADIPSTA
jgi:hypothetical protein